MKDKKKKKESEDLIKKRILGGMNEEVGTDIYTLLCINR